LRFGCYSARGYMTEQLAPTMKLSFGLKHIDPGFNFSHVTCTCNVLSYMYTRKKKSKKLDHFSQLVFWTSSEKPFSLSLEKSGTKLKTK
jgi:hypothetical protein